MDAAKTIAGILGPLYVAVGIGMLVSREHYRRMVAEFLERPALVYLGGLFAFVSGLLILAFHHTWSGDWRVVITVLGWLVTIKGAALLICPTAVTGLWTPLLQWGGWQTAVSWLAIALGLFLSAAAYTGF